MEFSWSHRELEALLGHLTKFIASVIPLCFVLDAILEIGFISNFFFHCLHPLPFWQGKRRATSFLNHSN